MTTRRTEHDLVAIGESLRDVFYEIDTASVSCTLDRSRCLLCLEYAEKIPVKRVVKTPAAGNAANAAVGARRLGLDACLVSWVGKDEAGDDILKAMRHDRVDTKHLVVDPAFPTSEATILNYRGERTQLVFFQPRTYRLPKACPTRCVYYTAMGEKHKDVDRGIRAELARRPETFFAFQPGTTHIHAGLKAIRPLIARSDLFILNMDEAHHLLPDGDRTVMNMMEDFRRIGSKAVIITDGAKGAYGHDHEGHWHMPIFPGKAIERTGAGDSFAIAATVAILKGHPLPEALRWGTANGWSVVREIGPQKGLLDVRGMTNVLRRFRRIRPMRMDLSGKPNRP
ncbi:carbohydrate kinase family protein [Candidatus Uhrbacteria bacterium]|nr:carbohydrate kinase family protein [Candidatus Uhrbacteria bacterium]